MSGTVEEVLDALGRGASTQPDAKAFVILDGARDERIVPELLAAGSVKKSTLYKGDLPPELEAAAPWLVSLERGESALCEWLVESGWGEAWGVFFFSDAKLKDLRKHFRKFLEVKRESGAKLVFRYYDPRVLRVYLPTCTPEERALVFGPVAEFLVEGHDPATLLRFAPEGEADGGGGSGKLVIRDAQWQAFAREELRKLALKSHAPRVAELGIDPFLARVDAALERAAGYGFAELDDAARLVDLDLIVGAGFDEQEPWAKAILGWPDPPERRLATLEKRAQKIQLERLRGGEE